MKNKSSEMADKMVIAIKFSVNTNVRIIISKCAIERK